MPWIAGDAWVRGHAMKLVEGSPNEHVPIGTAKSVLRDVLSHMRKDVHVAVLSVKTIADDTGWSESTTKRALHALERSGYLVRSQAVQNGVQQCSKWTAGAFGGGFNLNPGVGSNCDFGGFNLNPKGEKIEKRRSGVAADRPKGRRRRLVDEDRRHSLNGTEPRRAADSAQDLLDGLAGMVTERAAGGEMTEDAIATARRVLMKPVE